METSHLTGRFSIMLLCHCLQIFDQLLNGDITPYPSFFYNVSGTSNYYNFLLTTVSIYLVLDGGGRRDHDRMIV